MSSFIIPLREKYKNLKPIFCPYLGQDVLFTTKGFKHLIFKDYGMRPHREIKERFELLDIASKIISQSGTLQEYENSGIEFLGFIAILKEKKYKVVVLRSKDGSYKFYSVIPKWRTGIRDNVSIKKPPER